MADTSDYVRGGLFIVAFLLTGIWDLKRWFIADLVFTSMSGLYIYINPTWSINLQTKGIKVDDLHGHLNRVFAAFLIGPILIWLFCRKSKDKLLISAMLQSRTLSILLLIIVMSFGQLSYGKIFTEKHFWFGFLGNILWWLANVIQLVKNDQGPAKVDMPRGVALTMISRLNLVFLTLGAITYLTSPEQTIEFVKNKKLDNYHIHTARAIGAVMTGLVVFSWYIPRFKEKKSIRVVFLGQLLSGVLIIGSFSHLHFWSKLLSRKEFLSKVGLTSPLVIVSIMGLVITNHFLTGDSDSPTDEPERSLKTTDSADKKQQ